MSTLQGTKPADTYPSLLKLGSELVDDLSSVSDGVGIPSPLAISKKAVQITAVDSGTSPFAVRTSGGTTILEAKANGKLLAGTFISSGSGVNALNVQNAAGSDMFTVNASGEATANATGTPFIGKGGFSDAASTSSASFLLKSRSLVIPQNGFIEFRNSLNNIGGSTLLRLAYNGGGLSPLDANNAPMLIRTSAIRFSKPGVPATNLFIFGPEDIPDDGIYVTAYYDGTPYLKLSKDVFGTQISRWSLGDNAGLRAAAANLLTVTDAATSGLGALSASYVAWHTGAASSDGVDTTLRRESAGVLRASNSGGTSYGQFKASQFTAYDTGTTKSGYSYVDTSSGGFFHEATGPNHQFLVNGTVLGALSPTGWLVRQSGGTAGLDEVLLSHNGTTGTFTNNNASGGASAPFAFRGSDGELTDVHAKKFYGDGSSLTGISASHIVDTQYTLTTTNNTPTTLASIAPTLKSTALYRITVAARRDVAGASAGLWTFDVAVARSGAGTSVLLSTPVVVDHGSAASLAVSVALSSNNLVTTVTGISTQTWNWTATVEKVAEVTTAS